jgi:AraC-like DNA-binding protein
MSINEELPAPEAPHWMDAPDPVAAPLVAAVAALPLGPWHVYLHDFKHLTLDAGWVSGIHRHHYCEVDLLLEGHGESASMPVQPVGPGTLIYHAADVAHAWQASPGHPCRVLSLGFHTEPALAVTRPARWPVVADLLTEAQLLLQDLRQAQPGWEARLPLRLGAMLSRLLPIMAGTDNPVMGRVPQAPRLDALDRYLHAHLREPLTLNAIAEHLCVSRRTLTRIVQAHTGSSVMQRLHTFRLIHAAELLARTELNVAAVAERAGIPQLAYFCRCFRRHFGCSPTAYRRQLITAE